MVSAREIGTELLERWALGYLGHYASSAENLRRVLMRRVRRHSPEAVPPARPLIDAIVTRYREAGLLDDAAYAAARATSLHRRGGSLMAIRARLMAKGVAGEVVAGAVGSLQELGPDPDLAAACAFARRRRLGPLLVLVEILIFVVEGGHRRQSGLGLRGRCCRWSSGRSRRWRRGVP